MKAKDLPDENAGVVSTRAGYDRWAEVYESDGNPLTYIEEPVVRELLGDVRGLDVADIGCGTGRHALPLAAAGASVTAVDFSAGMLAKARVKAGAEHITFVEHDLNVVPMPLGDDGFDRVISCLVVEHIHNLDSLLREMRRICRRDGCAVITVMHPAMNLIGKVAGFSDPTSGEKVYPRSHPNQISDYVMSALRAGWQLAGMSEHAITQDVADALPRAEKYRGWLMLLVLHLR